MAKKFLPRIGVKRLCNMEKKEKDPKAKKRLLACILRKKSKTLEEIADSINEPYATVHRWLRLIEKEGLARAYDIKNKGAECRLTKKQRQQLIRDLETGPEEFGYETSMWTMPLANMHIKRRFGVDYDVHSVWLLVRRLGFRLVKPRPKLQNSATQEEIDAFKKKARRLARKWAKKGHTILTVDEAHVVLGSVPRRGWFRTKKPVIQLGSVKGARRRASIIGAIGRDGIHHFDVYPTANWPNFENFLHKIHKKFGRVLVFMDNASYHGKARLRQLTEDTGGDMQFEFILPYTPEMNPIETQWDGIKGGLSGIILEDAADACRRIRAAVRKKTIPIVKIHDYYTA